MASESLRERVAVICGWVKPLQSPANGWCLPRVGGPHEFRVYAQEWSQGEDGYTVTATATQEEYAAMFYWRSPDGEYVHPVGCYSDPPCADYDTSVDAALEAYEAMKARGWLIQITHGNSERWYVALYRGAIYFNDSPNTKRADAPTLALALCEAIVAAAGKGRG